MTGILRKSYAAVAIAVLIVSIYIITGVLMLSRAQYDEINTGNLADMVKTLAAFIPPDVFTDGENTAGMKAAFATSPFRVTLIRRNGQVIFDTDTESAVMENHLDRPEFQAAIKGGIGSERRKSASLGKEYIYAAIGIYPVGINAAGINAGDKNEITGVLRLSRLVPSFSSRLLSSALPFLIGAFLLIFTAAIGLYKYSRSLSLSIEEKLSNELQKKTFEITERIRENHIENSRREAILNGMYEGVISLDQNLKIVLANPRINSILNIEDKKDIRGASILEVSSSVELEKAAAKVLNSGQPFELILKRYMSGTEQYLQAFVSPLEFDRGVLVVLIDITRLVKLEQIRKDFAANVSHELRTPIQVIKGFAENILASSLDNKEEIRYFAEIIAKNTLTMENLTYDLLTLVSLENENAVRPPMEESVLAPLIAEAAATVEFAAKKKNISVEISCSPELSVNLYGSLFIQALVNLLENAIKYSGVGSGIRVDAYVKDDRIIIEVIDRGIGIPAEHMNRLFERFYRVDKARSREQGGTGLGLAIVRHIALLHNGKAEAESHAGEGSVFRLVLPVK